MSEQRFLRLDSSHAPLLAAIEAESSAFAWSAAQYRESLQAGCIGWARQEADQLVAFALFSVAIDEASLLNVAVAKDYQRQGVARDLLRHAFAALNAQGITRCLLDVRVANTAARRLYEALGFTLLATRRDYYRAAYGREDALVMQKVLGDADNE